MGILAASVAITGAGCATSTHTSPSTHAPPHVAPGSVQPPSVAFSTGDWTATGTYLETQDADFRPGDVINRPWYFRKICRDRSCQTVLTRETLYDVETAPVERQGGRYVVDWPPSAVPCPHYPGENAGSAEVYATLVLQWSANHQTLAGTERARSVGQPCGGGPPDVIRWVARRTNPAARPPRGRALTRGLCRRVRKLPCSTGP